MTSNFTNIFQSKNQYRLISVINYLTRMMLSHEKWRSLSKRRRKRWQEFYRAFVAMRDQSEIRWSEFFLRLGSQFDGFSVIDAYLIFKFDGESILVLMLRLWLFRLPLTPSGQVFHCFVPLWLLLLPSPKEGRTKNS